MQKTNGTPKTEGHLGEPVDDPTERTTETTHDMTLKMR